MKTTRRKQKPASPYRLLFYVAAFGLFIGANLLFVRVIDKTDYQASPTCPKVDPRVVERFEKGIPQIKADEDPLAPVTREAVTPYSLLRSSGTAGDPAEKDFEFPERNPILVQ